jgi:hypothetical protein
MKQDQGRDQEIIHRMLDGDAAPEEQRELMLRISGDPALREEFGAIERALRAAETAERKQAPPFFTAEVMKRLPEKKPGFVKVVFDFLFKKRVLKWNMAGAFGVVMLAVLVLGLLVMNGNKPLVTTAQQEQSVVVTMNLYAPEAKQVAVAGTFNKWKTDADLLTRGENGYWTISIPLKPGDYSYMFVVDGKAWVTDPNAESYRDDGFGSQNAVLRVKT